MHAGVVGHRGAAILIPGSSHAGKTSLVAALVRAGADYYSDEFAPLDAAGLVHPFAKPLSIRNEQYVQVDHHVAALGGVAGDEPLPVGAVVMTTYEAGRGWRPRRLSSGEAVLALLSHTVPAQSRPTEALRTISRSLERATVIEGARGEADTVAPLLLASSSERAKADRAGRRDRPTRRSRTRPPDCAYALVTSSPTAPRAQWGPRRRAARCRPPRRARRESPRSPEALPLGTRG